MKHRLPLPEQDDLLRPRLIDLIDTRHELVKLAALVDWDFFECEWGGFFPSTTGRPATSPRLVAGLLHLQHAFRLSDEAVAARLGSRTRITSTSPARSSSSTACPSTPPRSPVGASGSARKVSNGC